MAKIDIVKKEPRVTPRVVPSPIPDDAVDMRGANVKLAGTAHDWNRLHALSASVLLDYERNGRPLTEVQHRTLRAPAEGES